MTQRVAMAMRQEPGSANRWTCERLLVLTGRLLARTVSLTAPATPVHAGHAGHRRCAIARRDIKDTETPVGRTGAFVC